MNKSLKKLLEYSLVPALVLVLGKLTGIYIATNFLGIEVTFNQYTNNFLSISPSVDQNLLKEVTSYSDLFMFIFIASFFSSVLFRAVFFHSSHVSPQTLYHLAHRNLLEIIQDSYQLYHSGAVSLFFMWVASILIFINVALDRTYYWIGIVSITSSIILSLMLFQDVLREIENIKKNTGQLGFEDTSLQ